MELSTEIGTEVVEDTKFVDEDSVVIGVGVHETLTDDGVKRIGSDEEVIVAVTSILVKIVDAFENAEFKVVLKTWLFILSGTGDSKDQLDVVLDKRVDVDITEAEDKLVWVTMVGGALQISSTPKKISVISLELGIIVIPI